MNQLLVDSSEFWNSLSADLSAAQKSAFIQTFSFEGDSVGLQLARALEGCGATDRRLLIDTYSRVNHNDRYIPFPSTLWDREFRSEVRSTKRSIEGLRAAGVSVRFGMPLGLLLTRALRRDHKKLAVFDGRVAYLGGINFAEHNFAWHDFMVRVEDPRVARFLEEDIRASWEGRARTRSASFGNLDLHLLAGAGGAEIFRELYSVLDRARSRVLVASPYVSPPFTHHLARLVERGVRVTILTPEHNNKPFLKRLILSEARRYGFEVRLYPERMLHMKAVLIDEDYLVFGSSNFDLMGYANLLSEVVAVSRDEALIDQFVRRVLRPDLVGARAHRPVSQAPRRSARAAGLRVAARAVEYLRPQWGFSPQGKAAIGPYPE